MKMKAHLFWSSEFNYQGNKLIKYQKSDGKTGYFSFACYCNGKNDYRDCLDKFKKQWYDVHYVTLVVLKDGWVEESK